MALLPFGSHPAILRYFLLDVGTLSNTSFCSGGSRWSSSGAYELSQNRFAQTHTPRPQGPSTDTPHTKMKVISCEGEIL